MQIESGDMQYKDIHVVALRGPQEGIYAVVWTGFGLDARGMVGCGVYGYVGEDWVGVKMDSLKWFTERLREEEPYSFYVPDFTETYKTNEPPKRVLHHSTVPVIDVPSAFRKLDLTKGRRFNRGDMYFAQALGTPLQASAPEEASRPVLSQLVETSCPHARLDLNKCADCGKEMFSARMPGEA